MSWILALAMAPATPAVPPICTDRPTKANATCTVPAGKLQLETGLAGWSLTKARGDRVELLTLGATVVKFGITDASDVQVGVTPYIRLKGTNAGSRTSVSGFADIVVRYKQRLTAAGKPVQVAVIPFVKLPTAKEGLGNDKLEGGLAVPISFAPSGSVTMILGPEIDLVADADGHGRHAAFINLVNIAGPIAPKLTLIGEVWTNLNLDPVGTVRQASADAAIAYAASDTLQLDAGANFGLTRDTPDVETYAGISFRF